MLSLSLSLSLWFFVVVVVVDVVHGVALVARSVVVDFRIDFVVILFTFCYLDSIGVRFAGGRKA